MATKKKQKQDDGSQEEATPDTGERHEGDEAAASAEASAGGENTQDATAGEEASNVGAWTRERASEITALVTSTASTVRERGGSTARKVGQLVKDHPVASVAVVAGGLALVEAELAAAALVGVGVTVLVVTKTGPETRAKIGTAIRDGRSLLARGLARLEAAIAPPGTETSGG
jgi:hypothetical protein